MFRNEYDTDVTTFSPAGRIHQVEYACESVKQGSAIVGVRSKDFAVLVASRRSPTDVASFQKKIFKIDKHMGAACSGLIADARSLTTWMRNECLNHRWSFESDMQVSRLVNDLTDKFHFYTQRSEKRPFGVAFLIVGADATGPHLFEAQPSGNAFEYYATTLGARSQAAKTYLEKRYQSFPEMKLDDLIYEALAACQTTLQSGTLNVKNCQVGYVGRNMPFTLLEENELKPYVDRIAAEEEKKEEKKGEEKKEEKAMAARRDEKKADEKKDDKKEDKKDDKKSPDAARAVDAALSKGGVQ